jgi:ankyrin repeat protein
VPLQGTHSSITPYDSNVYSGHNSVQVCKYVYFCGYNILQIAAQNGHKRVVKMLLDRHKRLAYVENLMKKGK